MEWDVAGIGNALMDALVVVDDEGLHQELGLVRGTMHPVDHARWTEVYERVRHHEVVFDSGGSCANTVATVGRLGGRATYCGQVGDDQMGHLYASLMERACGGHRLQFTRAAATGKCLSIISAKDAERTMLTDLGAATLLPALGTYAEELRRTRIAHFTGYTLLGGPMREVALEGMEVAHAAGATISLDVADPFVCVQIGDLLWSAITRYADIVFLNREEARALAGTEDPEAACLAVAERADVETVAVKLGPKGSIVAHHGELFRIPAFLVRAVDTTGAGDAYAGGFLYGRSRGWDVPRSARLGSAVASLAVAQVGAVVKDVTALRRAIEDTTPERHAAL
jgi:sugar/nucleoside kinase (ribokinase family)